MRAESAELSAYVNEHRDAIAVSSVAVTADDSRPTRSSRRAARDYSMPRPMRNQRTPPLGTFDHQMTVATPLMWSAGTVPHLRES